MTEFFRFLAMTASRRVRTSLLTLVLLLSAMAPVATVQARPDTASEYYYGVEYDWTSLDSDLENVTGLDIQALFTEIMDDADDAGFNLDLGQLTTGSTNIYVHQTEDISAQTVQDADGNDVDVWSRTSDVTLRHGVLSNAVIMTDWSETNFGSDPSSFDIDVIATAENVLTVDIVYTEFLNDAYELVGADMDIAMTVGADLDLGVDVVLEGGGEDMNVDFNTGIDFEYAIASEDAEWRLGEASPIYVEAADNDDTKWNCVWDDEEVTTYEMDDQTYVDDDCGTLSGTYAGTANYELTLTGLPTEEFGFDAGEFDLSISDDLAQSGSYDTDVTDIGLDFSMRSDTPLEVNLGDGTMIDVVACDSCPPGSPIMFVMMAGVLAEASTAFGEAVAEDLEANLEDSLLGIFDDWAGELAEDDTDDGMDSEMFVCDSGEEIPAYWVNDGDEDCMDGSDEDDFTASVYVSEDSYSLSGTIPYEDLMVGMYDFECNDGEVLDWYNLNDGYADCSAGEDEYDAAMPTTYTCDDGTEISFELVNNDEADCSGYDDEGADGLYLIDITLTDGEGTVLAVVEDYAICEANDWMLCDHSGDYGSYYTSMPNDAGIAYGETTTCVSATLTDAVSDTVMHTMDNACRTSTHGPYTYGYFSAYGMELEVDYTAQSWEEIDDVTLHGEITDADGTVVWSDSSAFTGDGQEAVVFDTIVDVGEEGEYCLEVSMVEDGQTEPFMVEEMCDEATMAGVPSERLETIVGALAESGLEDVLMAFGENLEDTLMTFEEDTDTPEFPYVDGMWAPLWSNEHATIVGVAVYGYDEDDNAYLITGPETTGYSDDLPMVFASINYITGVTAMEAQTTMAESTSLEDIVDVEEHDLAELEQVLEDAGVDTSDLGLTGETDGGDGTDEGDGTEGPTTAEELAEEAGLPFLSPVSVIAAMALAGLAFNGRREDDE